ncbi:MAG: rod shape-determining protein [Paludibacteraceae bacterium]|nr:rod shape-determining protein [Paludibacteraceae bacterium]MBQ9705458.1 rod shape-determining protein [Paludibacteraceae bacterium]
MMKEKRKTQRKERTEECPLVAIDLGSSGIRAMAATAIERQDPHNAEESVVTLNILGLEEIRKGGYVEKGIVTQKTDAGFSIGRVLTQLSNRIGMHEVIDRAFVSIGGRLLQVCQATVKRDLISRNYISDGLLNAMQAECKTKIEQHYPQMTVISAEPVRYLLDGVEQEDAPASNQKARYFEVAYCVFAGTRESVENLTGGFNRANKAIENQWVRPAAHVEALASDEDLEEGCAIIDFGAQTTTLSVYQHYTFLHTHVIPLGGDNLTRDIQDGRLSFQTAEQVKQRFGQACPEQVKEDKTLRIPTANPTQEKAELPLSQLAAIIQARLDEILGPVMQEIGHYHDNIRHIYLTGGGSMLNGLPEYIQQQTDLPVEYGSHAPWLEQDAADEYYLPVYSALVGTLLLGSRYRKEDKGNLVEAPFLKRILKKTIDIFANVEN